MFCSFLLLSFVPLSLTSKNVSDAVFILSFESVMSKPRLLCRRFPLLSVVDWSLLQFLSESDSEEEFYRILLSPVVAKLLLGVLKYYFYMDYLFYSESLKLIVSFPSSTGPSLIVRQPGLAHFPRLVASFSLLVKSALFGEAVGVGGGELGLRRSLSPQATRYATAKIAMKPPSTS